MTVNERRSTKDMANAPYGRPHGPRPTYAQRPGGRRPVRRKKHKGYLTLVAGLLLAVFFAAHRLIPTNRGIALVIESALPWFGVLIVPLALVALFRLSWVAGIGVLIPTVVWGSMFGAQLLPQQDETASPDLTIATQNVGARLPQPTATADRLIAADPDIVTVQEIESLSGQIIQERLGSHYEHGRVVDTIGVWSRHPVAEPQEVDLGLGWPRAFRTTVSTDVGTVAFYAVHMPSVRPGSEATRNQAIVRLTEVLAADSAERIVLAGDLNAATTDRYFDLLDDQLLDSRQHVGGGFGFTWPGIFPVTRLDHVMVRGFTPLTDEVLGRGTSDHRAVIVGLADGAPDPTDEETGAGQTGDADG